MTKANFTDDRAEIQINNVISSTRNTVTQESTSLGNLVVHHNHCKSLKQTRRVSNAGRTSGIWYRMNVLLPLLKGCSLVTRLGSSETNHRSLTRTCQHSVYAAVPLTSRAWAHQWSAALSLGGYSTGGLAGHRDTGSGQSQPAGAHPSEHTKFLCFRAALSRSEQRCKRPSSSVFVPNTVFNHGPKLSRILNYKSIFLFCNF